LTNGWFGTSTEQDDLVNPFSFGTYHTYTKNLLPGSFLFKLWVMFAIVANSGQSWMSALLSKVLSSLWKNIFAAVAMALLAIIDKGFLSNDQTWEEIRLWHTGAGVMGIILTVFAFNLAPKAEGAKKH